MGPGVGTFQVGQLTVPGTVPVLRVSGVLYRRVVFVRVASGVKIVPRGVIVQRVWSALCMMGSVCVQVATGVSTVPRFVIAQKVSGALYMMGATVTGVGGEKTALNLVTAQRMPCVLFMMGVCARKTGGVSIVTNLVTVPQELHAPD